MKARTNAMKHAQAHATGRSLARARVPALLMLTTTALVSGCGGGGGGSGSAQNSAPMLTSIPDQTLDQGTSTAALAFTVSDDAGADGVTLTTNSSNPGIVPVEGIALGGSGSSRTLTVTPAEDGTGQAFVTITAKDAQGLSFTLTVPVSVRAVQRSILAFTQSAFAQMENDSPAQVSGFTFVQDADDENTFDLLLQ